MLLKTICLLVVVFLSHTALGQTGQVEVISDSSVQRVLSLYKKFATEKRMASGYRVQLSSGNSRQPLLTMKAQFLQSYPEVNAYVEYFAPQFKLRVGDFTSRYVAEHFRNEIIGAFPSAFVVPDRIFLEGVGW